MKTKPKKVAAARAGRRSPRNPTPRRMKVPVGKWKPRVKLTSKGPNRADMQRKVENTSIIRVPLDGVLADLIERLRSGEDVRFTLGGREALIDGLVIGAYKFALVPREELTAIRIGEAKA